MEISNIIVTGRLYDELRKHIPEHIPQRFRYKAEGDLTEDDFDWADAFVGFRPSPVFIPHRLKWVHALGAGVDGFLQGNDWGTDVVLTRTDITFGEKIAAYCMSYMLRHSQRHSYYERHSKEKLWSSAVIPESLRNRKAVIFGTGSIGTKVAETAACFGMECRGVSRSGADKAPFREVVTPENSGRLLEEADWVINTLPLTSETIHFFDEKRFGSMRGAGFINVGRGSSVVDDALIAALNSGKVTIAVLDVFPQEPLPPSSPYWEHERVIVTPHISAITEPADAARCLLETLERIERGEAPPNQVSIELGY
ncbi:D-2-hydroxyacid dehydrogenase [Paenibacillus thermotolerans]|uniref:D-2-hydroxyacid dehydrogenase n=1 Tax=Paenibacillus thermotolerans TaxID=3027807 RepID=UPI002368D764|nr:MULTISPECIES: D-2-hydroxyacid dehydrogenase [unclassified Paenibacillus]